MASDFNGTTRGRWSLVHVISLAQARGICKAAVGLLGICSTHNTSTFGLSGICSTHHSLLCSLLAIDIALVMRRFH